MSKPRSLWRQPFSLAYHVIAIPFRTVRFAREMMTPASVTLLLVTIVTLNIVWGYPWLGMFATCATLMVGGVIANRVFGPRLEIELIAPVSTPANSDFIAKANVRNVGRLPLFDATVSFSKRGAMSITSSDRLPVDSIQPGQLAPGPFRFRATRRGDQALPNALAVSTFPFSLFACWRRVEIRQSVMVTPQLLDPGEDELQARLAAEIGAWTRQQVGGESSEYSGNREYQTGMTVRRWDHASWARLGRPIVREYNAASVSQVTLLVDTADASNIASSDGDLLERLLSAAATAVTHLTQKGIEVRVVLTGEDDETVHESARHRPTRDAQVLLCRLAVADRVEGHVADESIERALANFTGAMLLLTMRASSAVNRPSSTNLDVVRVANDLGVSENRRLDQAHHSMGSSAGRSEKSEVSGVA